MASIEMVEKLRSRTGVTYEEAREALDSSEDDMLDAMIWLEKSGKATPPRISYYSTDADYNADGDEYSDLPYGKTDRYYDADKLNANRKAKKDKHREAVNSKDNRGNRYAAGKGASGQGSSSSNASSRGTSGRNAYSRSASSRKTSDGKAFYYDESDARARSSTFFKSAFEFIGKAFHIGNTTMFEITRYGREIIKIPLTLLVIAFCLFFQVVLVLLPIGLFFGFRYNISGNHFNDSTINSVMNTAADAADGIKGAFDKKKKD